MARIRIDVGPLSFERQADNTKAGRVIKACALAWGYDGDPADNQAVLDYFGSGLLRRIQEIAGSEEDRKATASALADNAADRPSWS